MSEYETGMVYRFRQNIHDAKVAGPLRMPEYGPFRLKRRGRAPYYQRSTHLRTAQVKALVSL